MRAFVAIALPPRARDALERVQEALPLGRAADPDQLHLTLAFLGERPDAEVEAAHEALEGLSFVPFALQLSGLDVFEPRKPEVLWAGIKDDAALRALQTRVLSALHGAGLPLERRRFRPHVTLARFGPMSPADHERLARFLGRWSSFPSPPFTVSGFGLWRSMLRRDGAVHEELARYGAGGAAWDPARDPA